MEIGKKTEHVQVLTLYDRTCDSCKSDKHQLFLLVRYIRFIIPILISGTRFYVKCLGCRKESAYGDPVSDSFSASMIRNAKNKCRIRFNAGAIILAVLLFMGFLLTNFIVRDKGDFVYNHIEHAEVNDVYIVDSRLMTGAADSDGSPEDVKSLMLIKLVKIDKDRLTFSRGTDALPDYLSALEEYKKERTRGAFRFDAGALREFTVSEMKKSFREKRVLNIIREREWIDE
jgi:hypothetical protein